ncbi:MAG: DUF3137 domain-containing protein [Bacilli bacterium]
MSVEELESLRIKGKNKIIIGIIISIALSVTLVLITKLIPALLIGFTIGIIITFIISHKTTEQFKLAFKKTFVLKTLKDVFSDLVYVPEKGIDESVIANTHMMDMGDRYSSNDYISGKYKTVKVETADVHIEEEEMDVDEDGNTSRTWITIFMGSWMIFDFNKSFQANVQVCQKGFSNARLSNFFEKTKYKKILLEDQEFNNKFYIYAQDEHDAFYILTPSLMEKLKYLVNNIKGRILLCFVDDKLHVGIESGKDSFEHSIFKKIDEVKIIESIGKEIMVITDFVDKLNLDNNLFRKED